MKSTIFLLLSPLALAKPCKPVSYGAVTTTSSATISSPTSSSSFSSSSSYGIPSSTSSSAAYSSSESSSSATLSSSYSTTSSASITSSASVTSTSSSASSSTSSAPPQATCGFEGTFPDNNDEHITSSIFISLDACRDLCIASSGCQSYVYTTLLGGCSVYSVPVTELVTNASENSENFFYSIDCDISTPETPVMTISVI
ncbi:hypothetical protein F4677DRAFT_413428 [Hypoxylon crocopeplum]|nr:hypothetical protein F4677DRAFT_413428 [Hypoxylon crocopeplum]